MVFLQTSIGVRFPTVKIIDYLEPVHLLKLQADLYIAYTNMFNIEFNATRIYDI